MSIRDQLVAELDFISLRAPSNPLSLCVRLYDPHYKTLRDELRLTRPTTTIFRDTRAEGPCSELSLGCLGRTEYFYIIRENT